jgi:hypothetical protein
MAEIEIGYKKNDFLWNVYPDASCNDDEGCRENRELSEDLLHIQTNHNGSDERYKDSLDFFNRKMTDIFALVVGILLGIYYIFINYNVLNSVSLGSINQSTSSKTDNNPQKQ